MWINLVRAFVCLFDHPVYQSLYNTLSHIDGIEIQKLEYWRLLHMLYRGKTSHFQKLSIPLSRRNLYVTNSPVMCLEAWEALLRRVPAIITEEYFAQGASKDWLVASMLWLFREYPFICFTKRTYAFLASHALQPYLVPPAERKWSGSKNRSHILCVSRMVESKNPFFVLELARHLEGERFVLVGRGPLLPEIRKRASSIPNLEIVESVETREELFRDYYAKAKVLVHPAHKDPVGFVVVEALSSSTPVLAYAGVGASDYLPEAWRIRTHSVNDWVRKIRALGDSDVALAGRTFELENLNVESPYFRETAQKISALLVKRGWL
jgi:glycosyltransferase involved in cell wall biosynthesis